MPRLRKLYLFTHHWEPGRKSLPGDLISDTLRAWFSETHEALPEVVLFTPERDPRQDDTVRQVVYPDSVDLDSVDIGRGV